MNAITMIDFAGESETLRNAELAACDRVLRSGWRILGKEVSVFESAWAAWLGVPYAVGCGNGLDAIEIGLCLPQRCRVLVHRLLRGTRVEADHHLVR